MRWLLFIVIAAMGMFKGHSQTLVQTYTDRCTGEVKVFSVQMGSSTVVAYYNKSRVFTSTEFTDGTLQAWLEETYSWWQALSPCSTGQASNQSTQNTTNQATSNATNAANNATSNTGGSTNTNTNGNTGSSGGTSSSSGSSGSSGSSSGSGDSGSNGGSDSGNSGSDSSGNSDSSGDSGSDSSSNSSDSDNSSGDGDSSDDSSSGGSEEDSGGETEESSSDESSEESTEEEVKEEESKEEESKEEESEEESKEEEKEEEEESKEENSEEEEEEEEEESKLAPPIVTANLVTMQAIDGVISNAASFGYSQASLTGEVTYSANAMIWSNLKQFSLNVSHSRAYFNYDREEKLYLYNPETKKEDLYFGSLYHRGSVSWVQTQSVGIMKMFSTYIVTGGVSNVHLGKPGSKLEGFVGGWAATGMSVFLEGGNIVLSGALTAFGTKPFPTRKENNRLTISPMLAYSMAPLSFDLSSKKPIWTYHGTYIIGSNFDFNITQRFKANIGGTIIGNTQPGFPLSYAFTVGSRFQF